jgi:hypothetical protein
LGLSKGADNGRSTWLSGGLKKTPPVLAPKLYGESGGVFFNPPGYLASNTIKANMSKS